MTPSLLLAPLLLAAGPILSTTADATSFESTGRYAEAVALCTNFQANWPRQVKCVRFGVTPEGRPMMALVVNGQGVLDPVTAKKRNLPVVLFQGGIHAGEIDGKDAGFWLLRDLLSGKTGAGVLNKVVAVFVPVFNVDGHERFGPNNRPNQRGPKEMGWRTTAQNLNLNRDYMKADAPEMAAMLTLLHTWDPIVYLDLHVTDGADFQPDVAVMMEPTTVGQPALRAVGAPLLDAVTASLKQRGHLPLTFYPSFEKEDDPTSGFARGIAPPRFSGAYWLQQQRLGVLVETHSWKPYGVRVKATYDVVLGFLERASVDGPAWMAAAKKAEDAVKGVGGTEVVLAWKEGTTKQTIQFPGYAYTREPSAVSGALMVSYDPSKKVVWEVPFWPEPAPALTVMAPRGGYVVPAAYAALVGEKLKLHGVTFTRLTAPTSVAAQAFHITEKTLRPEPYEGRHAVAVKGAWKPETRSIPAGSLYVPISQRAAMVIVHLFEPVAPDSLMAWGFFNAALEQKEYMEPYVAERVAREMMAANPALKKEFEDRLAADVAFARSPEARLNFFYQRHPSWDVSLNVYPVLRVDAAP